MLKPHAPAAARTVAAQIIQLKKLHRMRQLFQIRLDLDRIHHVIHDAHTEFHTRNHAQSAAGSRRKYRAGWRFPS